MTREELLALEENIATMAWHLGQPGAKLSVQHDKSGLIVDPGDVLKEISRRLSIPAQTMPWQPIETAPRNGTRIWLADANNRVTGYWSPPIGAWRCDWLVGETGDKPTHWQPLPDPPAQR
jgi:hypothetical protein